MSTRSGPTLDPATGTSDAAGLRGRSVLGDFNFGAVVWTLKGSLGGGRAHEGRPESCGEDVGSTKKSTVSPRLAPPTACSTFRLLLQVVHRWQASSVRPQPITSSSAQGPKIGRATVRGWSGGSGRLLPNWLETKRRKLLAISRVSPLILAAVTRTVPGAPVLSRQVAPWSPWAHEAPAPGSP